MTLHNLFKKNVDRILKEVKIEGRPILLEEIADRVGISREHFSRLYNDRYPVATKHIDYLMMKFPSEENITSHNVEEPGTESYQTKRRKQKQMPAAPVMVPFVPVRAQAGYVRAVDQELYLDTLEKFALPPGVSGHGAIWRYWEIEGESMEPVFRSGDIILTSLVHPMDWENIRNFYVYVIVTRNIDNPSLSDRVLIKRVYAKNQLEWVLISENEENYGQQLLPVEYIKEVWVYRRTWAVRAEPSKRFEIKV